MREKELVTYVKDNEIPYSPCNCPVGEHTMRNKIKFGLVRENEKNFPKYLYFDFFFLDDFLEINILYEEFNDFLDYYLKVFLFFVFVFVFLINLNYIFLIKMKIKINNK